MRTTARNLARTDCDRLLSPVAPHDQRQRLAWGRGCESLEVSLGLDRFAVGRQDNIPLPKSALIVQTCWVQILNGWLRDRRLEDDSARHIYARARYKRLLKTSAQRSVYTSQRSVDSSKRSVGSSQGRIGWH